MTLDFSRCRLPPFAHQREDTAWLLERSYAFIASEMRTGKSKIVVDAAQFLYERGIIDKVIVITPAPVRDVWFDPVLGEIAKHAWVDVPNKVAEHHSRVRVWWNIDNAPRYLHWYVTNFEFLRSRMRLHQLTPACGPKTLLVGDESSFLKNATAQQTQAFTMLRWLCGRVVLLNGTPIFHSPLDLFSQGNILHPAILNCRFVSHFKARYAVQTPILERGKPMVRYGKVVYDVANWTNLEDLERRFKRCTVRRLQAECPDMPPKLDPVTLTATLDASWPVYKQMRDEMVVWLKSGDVVTSATAAIKALRLSQITGGFLSGVEEGGFDGRRGELRADEEGLSTVGHATWTNAQDATGNFEHAARHRRADSGRFGEATEISIANDLLEMIDALEHNRTDYTLNDIEEAKQTAVPGAQVVDKLVVEVGREKLDVLLWFIEQRLEADPNLHLVAWSRFRAEAFRAYDEVHKRFPQFECAVLLGSQTKADRRRALALLHPDTSPTGPVFIAGIEGTGSFGINMTAAHTCVTMSTGYSPGRSSQTLDRVYGPGQKHPIAYYNIVAVGPKGQRTIDHDILTSLRSGEDIARRTAAAWVKALTEGR